MKLETLKTQDGKEWVSMTDFNRFADKTKLARLVVSNEDEFQTEALKKALDEDLLMSWAFGLSPLIRGENEDEIIKLNPDGSEDLFKTTGFNKKHQLIGRIAEPKKGRKSYLLPRLPEFIEKSKTYNFYED